MMKGTGDERRSFLAQRQKDVLERSWLPEDSHLGPAHRCQQLSDFSTYLLPSTSSLPVTSRAKQEVTCPTSNAILEWDLENGRWEMGKFLRTKDPCPEGLKLIFSNGI